MTVAKWIKQEKLRELAPSELRTRVAELKATLFTYRFQRATGKLENYRLLPQTKHRLAAVMTFLREKELASQRAKEAK